VIIRALLSLLVAVGFAAVCARLHATLAPELQLAVRMTGEHWYSLRADGRHVGYFRTRARFDADGNWAYNSQTHILMQPGQPLNLEKSLLFAHAPPHGLLEARHLVRQGNTTEEALSIHAQGDDLAAHFQDGRRQALSWRYRLADYLGVELALLDDDAGVSANRAIRARVLDLSQLEAPRRTYTLESTQPTVLSYGTPLSATRIALDEDYVPFHIHASGLFEFQRTTFADALAPANPAFKASYKIPLGKPLSNVSGIERLVFHIDGADLALTGRRGSVSGGGDRRDPARTLPVNDATLADIARRETAGARDPLAALVSWVHHRLAYRAGEPTVSVHGALARGYGECTDFADLLTTLALTLGWQARTVYGFAYDGEAPAGLAMHAWNEVLADGVWRAVDATFNQTTIDATHIALDDSTMARLKFLQGSRGLLARAVEIRYSD
jgi:hypothetical protein